MYGPFESELKLVETELQVSFETELQGSRATWLLETELQRSLKLGCKALLKLSYKDPELHGSLKLSYKAPELHGSLKLSYNAR